MEKIEKLHVLMIITSFDPLPMGGSEKQAFNLARKLSMKNHEISIFSFGLKGSPREEMMDGIMVYRMQWPLILHLFNSKNQKSKIRIEYDFKDVSNFAVSGKKSIFSFIKYYIFLFNCCYVIKRKKIKFHIVYVPIMEWTAYVGAILGKWFGRNIVIKDSTMNGISNLLRYPFGKSLQKYIIRNCHFVAMTEVIRKNYLMAGIPDEKLSKIPNGIEVYDDVLSDARIRNKFLFVGNLYQQPAKGVDVLLRAWKFVVEKIPNAELFIIGDGNTKEYYEYVEKVGLYGKVHFLGKQSNVTDHYKNSYAFILPSRREGMSNVLLEAMSFGIPCIATDISGNQDVITHMKNGILIPVQDERSLAEAVEFVYKNPEKSEQIGKEARKTIQDKYTLDKVSESYSELFNKFFISSS